MGKSTLDWIAFVLVIVGALNWGLVAWLDFNLVERISFGQTIVAQIVYSLVALAGIYLIYYLAKK